MRLQYTLYVVGILTLFLAGTMVLPLLFGLYYHDESVAPLLKSIGVTLLSGLLLCLLFWKSKNALRCTAPAVTSMP